MISMFLAGVVFKDNDLLQANLAMWEWLWNTYYILTTHEIDL